METEAMAIDRDDREERQARLDRMVTEFQEARRRRLAQASGGPVESHLRSHDSVSAEGAAGPSAQGCQYC
jgi:hypothetical protein